MTYSLDIRKRVVDYVAQGGSKSEASQLFKVNRQTIYNWLCLSDLTPKKAVTRNRKIDKAVLAADVRDRPDAYLHERAILCDVSEAAIFKALRRMNIVKKNDEVR